MKNRLLIFLCLFSFSKAWNQSTTPTWSADIACIIYSHCSSCHNPNGIAPFSMLSYDEAYDFRYAIQNAVVIREMPPWPPDATYRSLAHERMLTDEEIALISEWVNHGAMRGNPAEEPEPPVINSPVEIPSPDFSGNIGSFNIPSLTYDLYRCFVIPTNFTQDQYITGIEVIPGNRDVVHHVLVFESSNPQALALDAADPGPGYTNFGGVGVNDAKLVGAWVPGASAKFMPLGMGIKLPAGTNLLVQVHYPLGSGGQSDNTNIRLKLTTTPLREIQNVPVLNHFTSLQDGPLAIPANTVKTFHEKYTVLAPVTVLGVGPHAHLICESMWAYAVTPAHDTIPLINIPRWDFHWQGFYDFRRPLRIPFGTVVHGYARYNNTVSNPNNPNSPPQAVSLGEATTDEMMLFYFAYTTYQAGDENIMVDDSPHMAHYQDCTTQTVVATREPSADAAPAFEVYPNPASGNVTLQLFEEPGKETRVTVRDLWGRVIFVQAVNGATHTLNVGDLPAGMYLVSVASGPASMGVRKLMVRD